VISMDQDLRSFHNMAAMIQTILCCQWLAFLCRISGLCCRELLRHVGNGVEPLFAIVFEICERKNNIREAGNKFPVLGWQIHEATDFHDVGWSWPVWDLFNVSGVCAAAICINDVREKANLVREKPAFEDHFCTVEGTKDCVDMAFMFFGCLAENEDIVWVDDTEFVEVATQDPVHSPLKSTRCIG